MNTFSLPRVLAGKSLARRLNTSGWTCQRCQWENRGTMQLRAYSQSVGCRILERPRRSWLVLAVAGGAVGLSAWIIKDDVRHAYQAVERTGRVVLTLFVCINDYRITLGRNEQIEDEAEKSRILSECHQRCADRTLKVLEKNGSIFIKLGQHLSAMNYLLPLEWTTTFIPLQDKCPVSSFESVEVMFRADTGQEISDYFLEFAEEPIGAASLAQVHLATIKESQQKVAVKIQHPALSEWAALDLALTRFTFAMLKKFFPEYDLEWLSREMEYSLPQELDFTLEGQNAIRTKKYFSHLPGLPLVIPEVIWAKRRILVMENVSGHRPDDLAYLDTHGIDRDEVSAALSRIFNEMIFGNGAPLHCDPHGGNLAIRPNAQRRGCNFDVVLYDHGLYRDIPLDLRRSYAKLWLAVIDADEVQMRRYAKEVAGIDDAQFPLFASAITGREWGVIQHNITIPRSAAERDHMATALGTGMLPQLVQLLGKVPRIILLILKTNDLTRSLDANLHTRHGPVRTFKILARYCARTVLGEHLELLRARCNFSACRSFLGLCAALARVLLKLEFLDLYLTFKRG